jgi:hypothetical protein
VDRWTTDGEKRALAGQAEGQVVVVVVHMLAPVDSRERKLIPHDWQTCDRTVSQRPGLVHKTA